MADKDTSDHAPAVEGDVLERPSSLRVISLNCWGLKFISRHRHARLVEIGQQLAQASPRPQIVGLQECWTQQDYLAIRRLTHDILPHGKFYFSGIFGGGLAILSRWPIEESGMSRYPLNGRPQAFFRGDWYVGKGVASARIRIGPGARDVVEVFTTHLHAPYEREPHDSYLCHRTAQAWEVAKMMRHAAERGHMVLGLGDFNMVPLSLAHRLIEAHAPVRDVWRVVKPDSAVGAAEDAAERARGRPVPSAEACLVEHGATCDSRFNTWRWSKAMQKDLERGRDRVVDPHVPDPRAKRLDYIFFFGGHAGRRRWEVREVRVGMTMRHPDLRCSLSDHFSVEATLGVDRRGADDVVEEEEETRDVATTTSLPRETYDEILAMIATYERRERRQRRIGLAHFLAEVALAIGCFVAVCAGVLHGLIGGLFVGQELRALKEFESEIRNARERARARREG
ncbi:inositol phosphosphingolipids phospholipase C-like [Teratosphaeria destructans]|uniref:Inositol phosphosphingolipids phospholipase C-like n=1 Tax=Teratosphaeria destructans TaxID=418781 RepID=A0A9W7SSZ7_9PEZI|nr:inositol phosphosphingolipids phospholipase C-like [Teratosphaeria destructans]